MFRGIVWQSCKLGTWVSLLYGCASVGEEKAERHRWNERPCTNCERDILAGISKPRPRQRARRERARGKKKRKEGRKKRGKGANAKRTPWTERGRYGFGTTAW